jgi:hypothetical protein
MAVTIQDQRRLELSFAHRFEELDAAEADFGRPFLGITVFGLMDTSVFAEKTRVSVPAKTE